MLFTPPLLRGPPPEDKGRGSKSSGFGFVHFKFHEHALVALREVNNNPHIFGPARARCWRIAVGTAVGGMESCATEGDGGRFGGSGGGGF